MYHWSEVRTGALDVQHDVVSSTYILAAVAATVLKTVTPVSAARSISQRLTPAKTIGCWPWSLVYPVTPQRRLTWENMDAVMLIADKYGMPAIMQRAEYFIMDHLNDLSIDRNNKSFAWTWILRAEQCGLS